MRHLKSSLLFVALIGAQLVAHGCATASSPDRPSSAKHDAAPAQAPQEHMSPQHISSDDLPFRAVGPVAEVNGKIITAAEFNQEMRLRARTLAGKEAPHEAVQSLKVETLERLIDRALADQAVANSGVEVTPSVVDAELRAFKAKLPSEDVYAFYLADVGITEAEFRQQLAKNYQLRQLVVEKYGIGERDIALEHSQRAFIESLRRAASIRRMEDNIQAGIRPATADAPVSQKEDSQAGESAATGANAKQPVDKEEVRKKLQDQLRQTR
ncbi:SurA N-terminal domain-containing protein [Bradymonas sediminis]|nr:SurA N-terminal domain-containing protein [Bradymonas sediminis]TDP73478.1 SurA-like protein [Bradymonas sediminis]